MSAPESYPTQTAQTTSGVKPTNQESRFPSVVPVFPEAGKVIPIPFAAFAVPRSRTPSIAYPVRYAARGSSARSQWTFAAVRISPSAVVAEKRGNGS